MEIVLIITIKVATVSFLFQEQKPIFFCSASRRYSPTKSLPRLGVTLQLEKIKVIGFDGAENYGIILS